MVCSDILVETVTGRKIIGKHVKSDDNSIQLDGAYFIDDIEIKYEISILFKDIQNIEECKYGICMQQEQPDESTGSTSNMNVDVAKLKTDSEIGLETKKEAPLPNEKVWKKMEFGGNEVLSGSVGGWDQFKVNYELYGIKPGFDGSIYATPVDKNSKYYQENIAEARKIEREILSKDVNDTHRKEERGAYIGGNEEEKYSTVKRTKRKKGKKREEEKSWNRVGENKTDTVHSPQEKNNNEKSDIKSKEEKTSQPGYAKGWNTEEQLLIYNMELKKYEEEKAKEQRENTKEKETTAKKPLPPTKNEEAHTKKLNNNKTEIKTNIKTKKQSIKTVSPQEAPSTKKSQFNFKQLSDITNEELAQDIPKEKPTSSDITNDTLLNSKRISYTRVIPEKYKNVQNYIKKIKESFNYSKEIEEWKIINDKNT